MTRALLVLTLGLATGSGPAPAQDALWAGKSAAFFGVSFLDTSYEGEAGGARPDEAARVAAAEAQIADALRAQGVTLVDTAPVAEDIGRIANVADCNKCDVRFAERLGADYAVVSEVQKVSNLILAMNVVVRDARTGDQVRGMSVDIRGNTDDSWSRGVRYILRHGVFNE